MLPESIMDYVDTEADALTPVPAQADSCPYNEPAKNQRKGSTGTGTQWVQWMLVECGYNVGKCGIDGDFGKATHAAVLQFQADHALEVDGIVGPLTRSALKTEYELKKGA